MNSSVRRNAYRFCSLTLHVDCELLLAADGAELPLRPKSFALLLLLVRNAGRTVSKEEIMASVWPDLIVTENNINQCVHEIRRALGAGAQQLLRTRPRRGYLFAAEVVAVTPTREPCGDGAPLDPAPPQRSQALPAQSVAGPHGYRTTRLKAAY
jgi:DNA-binding winged helix-turn-helix (wHTH) protein